jgi:hypothetical protein
MESFTGLQEKNSEAELPKMLQGVSTNDIFEKLRHGRFPKPVLHPWG